MDLSEPLECIETNLNRWKNGGDEPAASESDGTDLLAASPGSTSSALDTVDELADTLLVDDVNLDVEDDSET